MNSEISTKRQSPVATPGREPAVPGFEPWHLFAILALLASAAGAIAVRGTRPENVVLVCLTILAAGGAAYGVYRMLWPLVRLDAVDAPDMLGGRTRVALEREKALVLRAIKELEFDRAMRKVSESDWQDMTGRLRGRAIRLIRQLDSSSAAYRDLIERELAARRAALGPGGGARRRPTGGGAAPALLLAALAAGSLLVPAPSLAQMGGMGGPVSAGMPDARAMSGIPRPSESAPAGTVTVRLVRGELSNVIVSHPVEFAIDGRTRSVRTDATGHAVCPGVPPGAAVQASASVDGERVESQVFRMVDRGGVVLMLVASDRTGADRAAVVGTVRLGGQTRILTQFEDEALQVYYTLDFVNGAGTPVRTDAPIVFDLPPDAENATVLEQSAPHAAAQGRRVTVTGPFPPGATTVQVAFSLPPGPTATVRQTFPVALEQTSVIAEKVGSMALRSPQLQVYESAEGGRLFLVGTGPGLRAGEALAFELAGLPHHRTWPRDVALGLGVLLLAGGAWGAARTGGRSAGTAARQQLERRRDTMFGELLRLDGEGGGGPPDEERATRRREIVRDLERVYGELDTGASFGPADQESAT
jgi:hypothetical protein